MTNKSEKTFMEKTAEAIVNGRWIVLAVVAALCVLSVFSVSWVEVENDITAYLADSAEAKRGLTVMEQEFVTYATARVMVEDVTPEEAQSLADSIGDIPGVSRVDYDGGEDSYRDNACLFNVTFAGVSSDETSIKAMAQLEKLVEPWNETVYSDSFSSLDEIIMTEMLGVLVIVVFVVVGVLLFTTTAYAEILVMLATFVVAAVINMGTNFVFGTISFVSNSVTIVLQLALSVDYAIILCNRYKEEHETLPIREAVISALAKSIPSIAASSLTTMAGLLAMTFMEFRLGFDMGINLIKSILFSLLSVFFFLPVMLVLCGRWLDKTRHKSFIPKVSFLGKFAYATRWVIPPLFIALTVLGYVGYGHSYYGYSMDIIETAHKNEQDIALEHIEERFGKNNLLVVMVPSDDYEQEAAFAQELLACPEVKSVLSLANVDAVKGYKLSDKVDYRGVMELADIDETMAKALISYCAADRDEYRLVTEDIEGYKITVIDMFLSLHDAAERGEVELTDEQRELIDDLYSQLQMAQDQLRGENYSRMICYIDLPDQGEETFAFLDRVHILGQKFYADGCILTGDAVSAKDFNSTFQSDNRIVSFLSIGLVMLILLFTFRSFGMPLLLILVIQGSIWLNFAIPAWKGDYVFFMCFLIVTAIQMGANIDYAIVISSRYSELRSQNVPQREAIIDTLNLAFPTVITSGLMMITAGLLIGARVSQCVIAGMGKYVGTGTIISVLLVNFALPQILLFGDGFVRATTVKLSRKLFGSDPARTWRRIAGVAAGVTALALLILLPFGVKKEKAAAERQTGEIQELSRRTRELRELNAALTALEQEKSNVKMDFAEHLVTDKLGTEQYNEGLEEYQAGEEDLAKYKQLLDEGKEEYRVGYEKYLRGYDEYLNGMDTLKKGQAEYDKGAALYEQGKKAAEEGQALYDEGMRQYEEGNLILEAGQAEYDEGVKQYEEGKAQLEAGEAAFAAIEPLYNAANSAYQAYLDAQARYDELRASPDANPVRLAALWAEVNAARIVFEDFGLEDILEQMAAAKKEIEDGRTRLAEAEEQLAEAKEKLDDGYARRAEAEEQLAEAKAELDEGYAQLAEAEEQLTAAKAELDDGYAQLAEGEAELWLGWQELEKAKAELDDGEKQITDGENELTEAEKQIKEGRETLDENRCKLTEDMAALDEISDDRVKLAAGMAILKEHGEITKAAGKTTDTAELLTAAEMYCDGSLARLRRDSRLIRLASLILLAGALCALAYLVLHRAKKTGASAACALLTFLLSLAGAALWRSAAMGSRVFIPALGALLALCGVLLAELALKDSRSKKTITE